MSMASSASRRARAPRGLGLVLSFILLGAATQAAGVLPAGASPSMQSTGSSFASVAIQQWVGQSATLYGLNINWQVSSSVVGLNNYGQNQIDFAASDIPYSAQQSTYYPNQPYQYMPDVAGGLAFMYNLIGNNGQPIRDLRLNAALVGQIFLGQLIYWDSPSIVALNPNEQGNLPHQNIIPVYRSDASGENYLLSDYLLHLDGPVITAAQNAFQSGNPGQPNASWPVPGANANYDQGLYKGWAKNLPVGQNGSDGAANYVSALSSVGSITYVETAYAKEHAAPVASLQNASGAFAQPTSVNVATALVKAQLHADLTQDLTGVYVNPESNSYPLSAYSYFVSPCSPSLAAAQGSQCVGPGASSPFSPAKGAALGKFVAFLACAGQAKMDSLGYSPLPPVLVQADFNAIGRLNGGVQPPPPTAANCKNPYVDGTTVLPGSPVVAGVAGGGVVVAGGGGGSAGGGSAAGGGSSGGGANGSSGSGGASGGNGTSGSGGSGSSSLPYGAAAAAAGLTPELAAKGYTVVNGQVVRTLGKGGPNQFIRADQLVAATDLVSSPSWLVYAGWAVLLLALLGLPPFLLARRRAAATVTTSGEG